MARSSKLDREVGPSVTVEVSFQHVLSGVKTEFSRRSGEVSSVNKVPVACVHAMEIDFVTARVEV